MWQEIHDLLTYGSSLLNSAWINPPFMLVVSPPLHSLHPYIRKEWLAVHLTLDAKCATSNTKCHTVWQMTWTLNNLAPHIHYGSNINKALGFQYRSVLPCYSMVIWSGEGFNIGVCSHVIQWLFGEGGFQYRNVLHIFTIHEVNKSPIIKTHPILCSIISQTLTQGTWTQVSWENQLFIPLKYNNTFKCEIEYIHL